MIAARISSYRDAGAGDDTDSAAGTHVLYCLAGMLAPPHVRTGTLKLSVVDERSATAEIQECLTINERAFDEQAAEATLEAAEGFRPQLSGCVAVTARSDGMAVAGGMRLPIREGVTELAGIGTLVGHRRRGYGAAVTAALAANAFSSGADLVFLTTADTAARSVYEKVGFTEVVE